MQFDANGNPIAVQVTETKNPAENTVDAVFKAAPTGAQRMINASMGILNVVSFGLIPAQKISLGSFEEAKPKGTPGIMDAKINPGAATLAPRGSNVANGFLQLLVRDHEYLKGSAMSPEALVCSNIGPANNASMADLGNYSPSAGGGGGGGWSMDV